MNNSEHQVVRQESISDRLYKLRARKTVVGTSQTTGGQPYPIAETRGISPANGRAELPWVMARA
jgi:hypothetical protein